MLNDNWELVKTITVAYNTYSDFDLPIIIKEYNEENNTNYKIEDIKWYWIKWNEIHLEMNDWVYISYGWILWELDCKRPDEVEYNSFDSEIDN